MEVELYCPRCLNRFTSAPGAPAGEVIDRMTDQGLWYALADGSSFEEMVSTALLTRGAILCPDCFQPVLVRETSLGGWIDMHDCDDEQAAHATGGRRSRFQRRTHSR